LFDYFKEQSTLKSLKRKESGIKLGISGNFFPFSLVFGKKKLLVLLFTNLFAINGNVLDTFFLYWQKIYAVKLESIIYGFRIP
jgi:hypothetical protein